MAAEENKKKLQKSYFDVLGLCCSSEVPLIEAVLKRLDGVREISVIVPSRTVIVVHDSLLISQLQIVKALNQEARLEANVRAYGDTKFKKKWPSPYAIASGLFLALSLLKYVYHPLGWLALGAVAVGILPMARKALASAWNLRLDANILMLIAVMGTIAMRDYGEAGTIVFLFTIAEWLESRASHKATAVMSSLMSIAPQKAVMADTGEEVRADEVKVDTIVVVKAGETIPIDGFIVEGRCEVDERTLTGESFPVSKQKASTVWAGTINLNGYIHVKATTLAEDCVVAKMAKLVEEAQNSKSKTQRIIDRCAKYYTPGVVLISASLAMVPLALNLHNRDHWFHLALVVLVSACPCALILSTPVATFYALSTAATLGLLVKGGDHLETLAKIKTVAFDKTGTITRGEFVVSEFRSLQPDIIFNTLLYWVSSIESKSSHPMAEAFVDYGRSLSIEPKPENVEEFQNFPGEGIHGKIDGKDIYIGNKKIGLRAGCETDPALGGDRMEGKSIGYIYSGTIPVGIFKLSDICRTGVLEAINELKLLGIKTVMLTGDSLAAAMHAQEQLGNAIDVVHSELLPEDKARIVTELKREGAVAMVGDGLNDAPALATADIGISMGVSGSALATETGNVILMSNDIRKIPKAVQIARKTNRKVIENIFLSISTKAAILALAVAGHPLVWAAVLADVGTCLLVIFNSMLLLRGRSTHRLGKHGCKDGSAHSHSHKKAKKSSSSCADNHCCSDVKASKVCEPQKCSSESCAESFYPKTQVLGSCTDGRCSDSADHHVIVGHAHKTCCSEDRVPCESEFVCHSANKTCSTSSEDLNHCCSPKEREPQKCSSESSKSTCHSKCSDSAGRQVSCVDSDEIHEVDLCCSFPAMPTATHHANCGGEVIEERQKMMTNSNNGHYCESQVDHHHVDIQPSHPKAQDSNCHNHKQHHHHHDDTQPPQPKAQNSNCHDHKHHHDDTEFQQPKAQNSNCHNHHHHDHDHHHHHHHHHQDKSSPFEIILPTMGSARCCRRRYFKECCGIQAHGHLLRGGLSEIITE